jgi:hypothetical protein
MSNQTVNITALTQSARPDVVSAIRQASTQTGVDFGYLLEKAAAESSFDPKAQATTSSARGLYQFIDKTWLDTLDRHGAEHGYPNVSAAIKRDGAGNPVVANAAAKDYILALRDNPRISALMAAEFAQDNRQTLEQNLGREVGNAELYMAHFLGAGGATEFLSTMEANPDLKAEHIVPAAAKANASVFYEHGKALTLDQVFARFEGKFQEPPEGVGPLELAVPPKDASPKAQTMTQTLADVSESNRSMKAAIFAALPGSGDSALAALQMAAERPERLSGALRADMASQLFTLSLLQAFDASDDERGKPNEWVV